MNVFQHDNFLEILKQKVKENERKRGYLGQMAESAKVHPSYFTRVVQGKAQLSLDQAMLLCGFWSFSSEETHYVMNRAIEERSSEKEMQKWARQRAIEVRDRHEKLENKIKPSRIADAEVDHIYYTHWSYGAIHVALMIPDLQTEVALSKHFRLGLTFISKILSDLLALGLIEKTSGGWRASEKQLHLNNDSPFAGPYHTSWRLKGMNELRSPSQKNNYQFTGVYALSKTDLAEFILRLKEFIGESHERFMKSKEEELAAICIDTFLVNR